jgi:hypothetical protein
MECASNLRQIGLAVVMYEDTHIKEDPTAYDPVRHFALFDGFAADGVWEPVPWHPLPA